MYLARREFGKLTWVYEIKGGRRPGVYTFTPHLGDGSDKPRRASSLSGPGICAFAETRGAALDMIHANEEAAVEELL